MKKRNGFTLVELLAVIVILAIILVIAIPQIIKTIDAARLGAFQSTAKLLISQAEKDYLVQNTLSQSNAASANITAIKYKGVGTAASGTDIKGPCDDLTKLSGNDYSACEITTTDGNATLNTLTGSGKFAGYSCTSATINNVGTACKKG